MSQRAKALAKCMRSCVVDFNDPDRRRSAEIVVLILYNKKTTGIASAWRN